MIVQHFSHIVYKLKTFQNYTTKQNLVIYLHTVHDTHTLQVTICSHSTDDALHIFYADTVNQMCNF